MQEVSIKDLAKPFRTLSSTGSAILSTPPCMKYKQRQQIHSIFLIRDYNSKVVLDPFCTGQLNWWMSNLRLSNGRSVISHQVELLIKSDGSKTSWGLVLSEDISRKVCFNQNKRCM